MISNADVFKPEKEKSQFVFFVKGIGSLNFLLLPLKARKIKLNNYNVRPTPNILIHEHF